MHVGLCTETVPALLLGVDHRFETSGPPQIPSHFRGDYFAEGTLWNLPDLEEAAVV